MRQTFTSVVFFGEKYWVAKCVELGVISQGETSEEALENLKEAVALYLEDEPEAIFPRSSQIKSFEVEYVT